MLVEDTVTLPIQINGKRRSEITVPKDMAKEEVEKLVLADDAVQQGAGRRPAEEADRRAGTDRECRRITAAAPF